MHACIYVCVFVFMYADMRACVRACVRACMCACMRVCMCVCMHARMHIHMHDMYVCRWWVANIFGCTIRRRLPIYTQRTLTEATRPKQTKAMHPKQTRVMATHTPWRTSAPVHRQRSHQHTCPPRAEKVRARQACQTRRKHRSANRVNARPVRHVGGAWKVSMRRFRGQGQAEEMRMATRLRSGREAISICQTPAESLWRMSIMVHMEYACCHLHIYIERECAQGARERERQ